MDLFHAVTQGIDSVLTCDWYDSFKTFNPASSSSSSSSTSTSTSTANSRSQSRSNSTTRRLSESITTLTTNMAPGSDQKLMDTEPGGESTQYESIKTVTEPSEKERGQLGSGSNTSESAGVSDDRGQQTADNIRYGQNISESGVGGKTTTSTGSAEQAGGYGGKADDAEPQKQTRREQGYGPGSGVGA